MNTYGKLTISIHFGSRSGSTYTIEISQVISIGKGLGCDLVLTDRGVSRNHCLIDWKGKRWSITDLGSTNGTVVNGTILKKNARSGDLDSTMLSDGDEVEVGEVAMKIEIPSQRFNETEVLFPRAIQNDCGDANESLHPRSFDRPPSNPLSQPLQNANRNMFSSIRENIALPLDDEIILPSQFLGYRLERKIGVGGMGEVFLATNEVISKQLWAVKFLKPQANQSTMDRKRLLRETQIALGMQHSAIVRCIDSGEEKGKLFLVMDYCNGGNLSDLLKRSGQLNIRRAFRLMNRLLSGVDHAHKLGIIHRDLKPSNILLHRGSDGKYQPKIGDFGLAKSYLDAGESGMTARGCVGGSWGYMPREQLTNFRFVQPQSDVWSLGAILYECLTLRLPRPFEKGVDPIRTILESDVMQIDEVLPDIHPLLSRFVMKSLATETQDRFDDAGSMQDALINAAGIAGVRL